MSTPDLSGYDIEHAADGADVVIALADLETVVSSVLSAAGFPEPRARLVAASLVDAEARGISSHGVSRARIYARRVSEKLVDATAVPTVTGRGATRRVDAHNAPGQVGAEVAVGEAIAGARESGVCFVGVLNSNHCGTLSFFLRGIAEAGLIGFAMTNGPAVMAYHGGRSRAVGTNPFGYSVPRADAPPIVLDMATSNAARGKIISMARSGVGEVPNDWAVDVDGRMTNDPVAALAGAVLPFSGPKGSGMAMGIDLLCGALLSGVSGDDIGDMYENWDRPQRVGHVFGAVDPGAWLADGGFAGNVDAFVDRVHALPPAVGQDRVFLPGEIEEDRFARALEGGIQLTATVAEDLRRLTVEYSVPQVGELLTAVEHGR
ncbi:MULTISPECIES: Ldh family oxidoreductase [unclassified Nocardioides]|uniref:Ldh family oxidoreductase n=1 Tax=unclassified Nocardioides TaxID=2615069 RepID=UPI0009F151FD|nr:MULTISPECIES: Ldh family oxidoreductase [unclassified Nocardioides]GAW51830.1 Malate dehydrogenase [Nocardioides sp. PD653-B2]GAW53516.1 Malate dehydrogenase [Nocardioides sp. PD653]